MNEENKHEYDESEFDDFGFSDDEHDDAYDDSDDDYSEAFDVVDEPQHEDFNDDTGMDNDAEYPQRDDTHNPLMDYLAYAVILLVIAAPLMWYFRANLFGTSSAPSAGASSASAIRDVSSVVPTEAVKAEQVTQKALDSAPPTVAQKSADQGAVGEKQASQSLAAALTEQTQTPASGVPIAGTVSASQPPTSNELQSIKTTLEQISSRLGQFEGQLKSISSLQQNVDDLKAVVSNESQDVLENQRRVDRVNQAVQSLDKHVQKMTRDLYRKVLSTSQNRISSDPYQKNDFVVMAAIPTRAWLRNKDGVLVTVRVGETLPGYGTVKKINSVEGTVTMSNHVVFAEETKVLSLDN